MISLGKDVDETQTARGGSSTGQFLPLVSLQNISLGYDSVPVVQGISLAIYPSSLIGLAGPNGSGKTTLFRAILGLLPILGGSLSRSCPLSNFGYVPQSAALERIRGSGDGCLWPRALLSISAFERKGEGSRGFASDRVASPSREIFLFIIRWTKAADAYCASLDGQPEDHDFR